MGLKCNCQRAPAFTDTDGQVRHEIRTRWCGPTPTASGTKTCSLFQNARDARPSVAAHAVAEGGVVAPSPQVPECASASKWDPTFSGIKFLNTIAKLRN